MPRRSTTAPEVSPPATTSRRTPDCDQPLGDIGHRLLDGVPRRVAAMARLQAPRPDPASSCEAIRTGPLPSRSLAQPSARWVSALPATTCSGSRCSTGMICFGARDLREGGLRTAAGQAGRQAADRRVGHRGRRMGRDPPRRQPARGPDRARAPMRRPRRRDPARPRRWFRDRARTRRRRSRRQIPCRRDPPDAREPHPRRARSIARSTRPTLVLLCRPSTRTRLESCIGLSGWSFSGLSFSGTRADEQIALVDGAAGLGKCRRHQHDGVAGIGAQRVHDRADIAGIGGIEGRADLEQHVFGATRRASMSRRRASARPPAPASIERLFSDTTTASTSGNVEIVRRHADGLHRAQAAAGQGVGEIGGAGVVVGDAAQRQCHDFAPA